MDIEVLSFEDLLKMKEESIKAGYKMTLKPTSKNDRWEDEEKVELRMYLLSFYKSDDDVNWKLISNLLQTRTSVQVRTHVQKFKTKTKDILKKMKNIVNTFGKLEYKNKLQTPKECLLCKEDALMIHSIWDDYYEIIRIAKKKGKKGNSDQTYEDILRKNKSIPNFIIEHLNSIAGDKSLEAAVCLMMKDNSQLMNLLLILIQSLEQEVAWLTMSPSRLKNEEEKNIKAFDYKKKQKASSSDSDSYHNFAEDAKKDNTVQWGIKRSWRLKRNTNLMESSSDFSITPRVKKNQKRGRKCK